jgi:NAD(P)H-hydrate epimerase
MILATPAQMRELDSAAARDYGIPSLLLMENAAYGISEYIAWLFECGGPASRCGPSPLGGHGALGDFGAFGDSGARRGRGRGRGGWRGRDSRLAGPRGEYAGAIEAAGSAWQAGIGRRAGSGWQAGIGRCAGEARQAGIPRQAGADGDHGFAGGSSASGASGASDASGVSSFAGNSAFPGASDASCAPGTPSVSGASDAIGASSVSSGISNAFGAFDAPDAPGDSGFYGAGRAACAGALFVCGGGNNGGDGFAAARMLFLKGFRVAVVALAAKADVGGDAGVNLDICEKLGAPVIYATEETVAGIMRAQLAAADLVVDAIFGTGFRGRPSGASKAAIEAINASQKPVLSIDAPSGLDSLSGAAPGPCVRAGATMALGLLKRGLVVGPDAGMAGRLMLRDIGLPGAAARKMAWDTRLATGGAVRGLLAARKRDAHKGDFGKIMAVTGSAGMTGAGMLTGAAALRAGAGLVYLAVPGALAGIYEAGISETITIAAGGPEALRLGPDAAGEIVSAAERMDAVAIGPGLSAGRETRMAVRQIISGVKKPLVIDADALNAVSDDVSILAGIGGGAVLTPHEGEMARLLGTDPESVRADRLGAARGFAVKWGVTLVLKGFRTIIATPGGTAHVNPTGNPGMATAGAGDVLTGIIVAFIGGGMAPHEAALAAAYLHGLAGDLAAFELGEPSVTASDIARHLPAAMKAVASGG